MLTYSTGHRGMMPRYDVPGLDDIKQHLGQDEMEAWITIDDVTDVKISAVFLDDVDGDPDPAPLYEIRCEKGDWVSSTCDIDDAIKEGLTHICSDVSVYCFRHLDNPLGENKARDVVRHLNKVLETFTIEPRPASFREKGGGIRICNSWCMECWFDLYSLVWWCGSVRHPRFCVCCGASVGVDAQKNPIVWSLEEGARRLQTISDLMCSGA